MTICFLWQGHVRTVNYLSTLGQSTYQDSDGMAPPHICAATKHVKVMVYLSSNYVKQLHTCQSQFNIVSLVTA